MRHIAIIIFCVLYSVVVSAQQLTNGLGYQKEYKLPIKKATEPIKVDGNLSEAIWQNATNTTEFWNKFPIDEGHPKRLTKVMTSYDDKNLYVAATIYDTLPYVIPTLKRDAMVMQSDGFGVFIDPVNQRTNGFYFRVTPMNVQAEDLISASVEDIDFSWDNKWFSQTQIYPDRWTVEIAIPFKTLRYQPDKTTWGINFVRVDQKNNQFSTWTHMPVNFRFLDFGWTGALEWDAPPPKPGSNMVFVPYTTGGLNQNKVNNEKVKTSFNAGFDGKIALTPSLNLDLTFNPDFSQIDVDRQVTNLTRFNIFFPERRTFFLENQDLFSNYGIPPIRPFYSRRIGLDASGNVVPIIAGARISGNLNKKLRVGFMNMQTLRKNEFAPQNYTAFSFSEQLWQRSAIKGYYLGHEASLSPTEKQTKPIDKYGRNAGAEYSLKSNDGKWETWGGVHKSYKPGITDKSTYLNAGGGFFGRIFEFVLNVDDVGTNYYTDMGFIERIVNYDALLDTSIRLGFKDLYNSINYKIYPKEKKVNRHEFTVENYSVWNPDNTFNERTHSFSYEMFFSNTGRLQYSANYQKTNLRYYTSFTDGKPLPPAVYRFAQTGIEYSSDRRKLFNWRLSANAGQFYNGRIANLSGNISYRSQPHFSIGINFDYNKIKFPAEYGSANLFLLAPQIEYNFSTSLFWTTFLQYNTQANNVNINSRLQWRYKPMSDLFLVYTDNYYSDPLFKNKSRAIVFKWSYWLNL
jgi:hypothetical protein